MHAGRRFLRSPPRSRGFTLLELLIVVAIVGLLSAIAVAGYLRYVHQAQSAEPRTVMGQIRAGEEAFRAETLQYLGCSNTTPVYYPNANPDDTRWVWERSGDPAYNDPKAGWAMLGVHPDAPVRYGYMVYADIAPNGYPAFDKEWTNPPKLFTPSDGTPFFVVTAKNRHTPGVPSNLLISTSYDGNIYSENDDN